MLDRRQGPLAIQGAYASGRPSHEEDRAPQRGIACCGWRVAQSYQRQLPR
jgi:hypothetical protein